MNISKSIETQAFLTSRIDMKYLTLFFPLPKVA